MADCNAYRINSTLCNRFCFCIFKTSDSFCGFHSVGLYVFFMSWFGYLYQAAVNYSQMRLYCGNPVEMHVIFFSKFFRVVGSKDNYDFLYSQINDVIDLDDMLILTVSGKGIITHGQVIDKKALTDDQLKKIYNLIYKKYGI